ncbi:MAG: M24 family metallopeptidase [Bryobacterales bacterium]|nr:M24 family metallopeptidase [Bryobacterales bacterium]
MPLSSPGAECASDARCGNAVVVLEGQYRKGERGELRSGFFQDPQLLLPQRMEASRGAMLLSGAAACARHRIVEILVLPDREALHTESLERTASPMPPISGMARRVEIAGDGGGSLRGLRSGLSATLLGEVERLACIHGTELERRLRQAFPFREIIPLSDAMAKLRMRKSDAEIARIREAVRVTAEGQLRGWRSLQSASNEFEVAADITHEFLRRGAERHAFAPIVAAGANACVLHYSRNRAPLRKGDLAILDVGAECDGYAGDLTRTIPVGGRFSKRHRALYEAVLTVQKEVIAAVRPGASIAKQIPGSLHQLAVARFNEMRLGPRKEPLGNFFPHGIGHHLGMDVHDPGDPLSPLEPGMVVTIEPGVYLPEEGIGIRIEDDVLVTAHGSLVLSDALPKEVADVEALLRS